MDWLNYHHLLNFWLVVREGSVKRASELMHVTPASISTQVKQLERDLDVKLLKKQGRGLVPTEMGAQVAEYASEIFSTGHELMEMIKGRPVGKPLELRVGIRDVMPKLVAFRLLKPALEQNQQLRLICHEGEMSELVAALAIHKLDVILTDKTLDPLYRVQAYSHQLGESDVSIVATKELAKKYRRGFPSSLDGAPFLLPMNNSVLRRSMDLWFSELNLAPNVKGEFADSAMLKIAGRQGLGLFAIPACIEDEVIEIYGLSKVGLAAGVKEQFYAISVERKLKHPAVIAIREDARSPL
ncbi:LysR family transcriptional regulator [uncultured Gimesia sp.]|mgnify:CR=1 FL=1|uniref:LysR family transcriptional regulator n=1 Tax=uncultured Gimesia sp. TaxID=1678688 RepID=UPI0026043A18|nr:LysR family transcriptional regulator [uncultured Gimesia sp.]